MKNKNLAGFVIIMAAAIFGTLAFVLWPTIFMTNEQATSQTEQVVQDFYDWYLSYDGNPLVDHAYRNSQYLRPEMVAFLDGFSQDGMGYDPVLCAQDKPASISATASQVTGGWASVEVTTSFEGHGFSVELIQTDGDWLIDKVNCAP
jgi:hypothetical protein